MLELDGVRWTVRVHRDSVATASIEGLVEAYAEVLRTERPASEAELATMLELELRDVIKVRTERLLAVGALMRRALG